MNSLRELEKEYRALKRDTQQRYYQIIAYERRLKEELNPDEPEWGETYEKLAALEDEQDAQGVKLINMRCMIADAERELYYEKLRAERGAEL